MLPTMKREKGFTLIELMVAVAISAIVLGFAVPSFANLIKLNRLATLTNTMVTTLGLARSEAIKRGRVVSVRRLSGTSNVWEQGWIMFVDTDGDGVGDENGNGSYYDSGDEKVIRQYEALPAGYSLRTAGNFASSVRFLPTGLVASGNDTFALCSPDAVSGTAAGEYDGRGITLNLTGRVRSFKGTSSGTVNRTCP